MLDDTGPLGIMRSELGAQLTAVALQRPVSRTVTHVREQLASIVSRALRLWLAEDGAKRLVASGGEVLVMPSGLPHRAEALVDRLAVDTSCPPRQDWITGDERICD